MRPGQSLSQLTARLLTSLENYYAEKKPDLVLAHGDTTTCFAGAVSSFYHQIPFFHVEAGLRTHRLNSPFPEEFNRQTIAGLASHHFAPTELERRNLLAEGISSESISVTGSTLHDAIRLIVPHLPGGDSGPRSTVTVTLHRRESNQQLQATLLGIKNAARLHPETLFVCPVHPNPSVRAAFHQVLRGLENVQLTEPMDYPQFVSQLMRSRLIVTDSGGVQEEAAFFGKHVLIARNETEREDGLASGRVELMGVDGADVQRAIGERLASPYLPHELALHPARNLSASEIICHQVIKATA